MEAMIRKEIQAYIKKLELFIQSHEVPDGIKPIKYDEFRVHGGNINYFFDAFKFGYDLVLLSNRSYESVMLSYPRATIFGHHVALSSHFFGVKVNENFTEQGLPTAMESATTIGLFFMLKARGLQQKYRLLKWQLELDKYSENGNYSDLFIFYIYGDQIANVEMAKGNLKSLKLFIIGALLMVAYIACILQMFTLKSKILLISAAIASPLLATIVSFALMQWFKFSIVSLMGLIPLLMMGIGVDDAFHLIHAWQNYSSISSVRKRMANVVNAVGPGITITSVTNILAFATGSITAPPMMSSFCLCMLLAVAIDYILELTIFAPILAVTTYFEHDNNSGKQKYFCHSKQCWILLSQFLASKIGLATVFTMQAILYVVATIGVVRMEANFNPSKTFSSDSKLITCVKIANFIYKENLLTSLVVNKPPDISNVTQYNEFMELVHRLEGLPASCGPERTLLWLRDYVKYVEKKKEKAGSHNTSLTYQYVPQFLTSKFMAEKNVLHYHTVNKSTIVVDSFIFTMVSHGMDKWTKRAALADLIRSILDDYPQFNVTLFDYDGTIFDLILNVKHELIKAAIVTMACITLACFVFIANFPSTIVASLAIFSIFYCLMGILSLLGLDLDPITMTSVIIAIGLSVDFSAHICYHFIHHDNSVHVSNELIDQNIRKLADVYVVVGEPTVQAAISTIISMLPVLVISTKSIEAFAKTIVVVVLLGTFHGIIIVPAILSLCSGKMDKNDGVITAKSQNIIMKPGSDDAAVI